MTCEHNRNAPIDELCPWCQRGEGYDEAIADVVKWLRDWTNEHVNMMDADAHARHVARLLESGEWKKSAEKSAE